MNKGASASNRYVSSLARSSAAATGFGVQGSGFGVQDSGFGVQGSEPGKSGSLRRGKGPTLCDAGRPGEGPRRAKSVVVVGAGGNIGSHLVPHLGRMDSVGQVTLIDRDMYEPRNLRSQDITPAAVNKPKATVQARRLRRINPALRVTGVMDAVENLPLGWLRSDVILAGLDSRQARKYLNQAAWRMGVPWIDAGVEPGQLLARVEVYVPGPEAACLECTWDQPDYDLLEQEYPCTPMPGGPAPTNGLSSLGALAASLQAIECHKLLSGQSDRLVSGRQVLIDASYHKHYVTGLTRNPQCRFDHDTWPAEGRGGWDRLPAARWERLTIGQALELGRAAGGADCPPALRVEGQAFVGAVACTHCDRTHRLLRLQRRLRRGDRTCSKCGRRMVPVGFEMLDQLDAASLTKRLLGRGLRSVGLRPGDVYDICAGAGAPRYYELGD